MCNISGYINTNTNRRTLRRLSLKADNYFNSYEKKYPNINYNIEDYICE
jgi:hypothetical protein